MSSFLKNFLVPEKTTLIFRRYRGKINIQKPRQPHYERARVLSVTKPYFPKFDLTKTCFEKTKNLEKENPYDLIIAKEVKHFLDNSKMVAIFHMNSITQEEIFKLKINLHKHDMNLKYYGKKIIQKAIKDTKYEVIEQLFDSSHCLIFSNQEKFPQLLKIVKKVPQMILMAGIIQDKLLSHNEILEYSKLPDIHTMHQQLVGLINSNMIHLVNDLETQQQNLVNALDSYSKDTSK